ncbi:MAG: translation initiation factor IF-2 [bacterium]|nr:translation initiation factor IF-2 [bacterium]
MGKISVQDLAKKMGVEDQDLIFKLKSIGVQLDDKNPEVDSEIIAAVLQGKSLRQPREVILRDAEAKATVPVARKKPPQRRMPTGLKPRGRRMIQRVQPRIRTIPTTQKPQPAVPATPAPAEEVAAAPEVQASATPATQAPSAQPTPPPTPEAGRATEVDTSARRQRRSARRQQTASDQTLEFKHGAPTGPITISEAMTVREFAEKLDVKSKDLIKYFLERGMMATINHIVEPDLAVEIAEQLGVEAMAVSFEEEIQLQQKSVGGTEPRAPVVTIMGHVDHGKTTLLDSIRSSRVTESEFGGITQHIGAYQVDVGGRKVVFLDTPGHEAFTLMRSRGAKATDIVVLVVAADDSVMPQTIEAIDHAKAANVPILVAINKIDKSNANVERVKKELADHGVAVEEWGGDTIALPISALKQEGISELLEMLLLTADILELKADPGLPAQGVVLEAKKEAGRGILATVLVQNGTLRRGDVFVAGATFGKVRSMLSDLGERLDEVEPATPIEVMGFDSVPEAGDPFQVVEDESKARSVAEFRQEEVRRKELAPVSGKASLEQLFDRIQQGEAKELAVVLKADVQGSVEVIADTLRKQATEQVRIEIIRAGVGAISNNDILLAAASDAIVVGFNVRPEQNAADLADKEQVDIRLHTVIYELTDEIRKAMTGLLEPTFKEVIRGRAEVREIFSIPKQGVIAGCHVIEGTIPRNAQARLLRDNVVIHDGALGSLRRFKDDVAEVRTGFDCGIRLEKYQDVKPGDLIEAYAKEEVAPTL